MPRILQHKGSVITSAHLIPLFKILVELGDTERVLTWTEAVASPPSMITPTLLLTQLSTILALLPSTEQKEAVRSKVSACLQQHPGTIATGDIQPMFGVLLGMRDVALLNTYVQVIARHSDKIPSATLLKELPRLLTLHKDAEHRQKPKKKEGASSSAVVPLWWISLGNRCRIDFALKASANCPPPTDWNFRLPKLSCNCMDCEELLSFLNNSTAQVHSFKMNQTKRSHIEGIIFQNRLDLTHKTITTRGSPYTLECTKMRNDYAMKLRQIEEAANMLKEVETLMLSEGVRREAFWPLPQQPETKPLPPPLIPAPQTQLLPPRRPQQVLPSPQQPLRGQQQIQYSTLGLQPQMWPQNQNK